MARKKKVVYQDTEPRSLQFVITDPAWVEPNLSEKEPKAVEVVESPPERRIILHGNGLHHVGINGTVRKYKGGVPTTVEENIYLILKDADLIREEL